MSSIKIGYTSFISSRLGGLRMSNISIICNNTNTFSFDYWTSTTNIFMTKPCQNFYLSQGPLAIGLVFKRTNLLNCHFCHSHIISSWTAAAAGWILYPVNWPRLQPYLPYHTIRSFANISEIWVTRTNSKGLPSYKFWRSFPQSDSHRRPCLFRQTPFYRKLASYTRNFK